MLLASPLQAAHGHARRQVEAGSRRRRSAWWRMQVSQLRRRPRRDFRLWLPFSVLPAVPQCVGPLKTSHARSCEVLEHLTSGVLVPCVCTGLQLPEGLAYVQKGTQEP